VKPKVYVEGGGNRLLDSQVKEGFKKLFDFDGVQFVPCGSRSEAFKEFKKAVLKSDGTWPILLVDSEDVVTAETRMKHLESRPDDQWKFPDSVAERQVQLMMTCTESWLICDKTALKNYFGDCFEDSGLPTISIIESQDRKIAMQLLKDATQDCAKEKRYAEKTKGKHSFKILKTIKLEKLRQLPSFVEAEKAIRGHAAL
jgi:hypothetical protein